MNPVPVQSVRVKMLARPLIHLAHLHRLFWSRHLFLWLVRLLNSAVVPAGCVITPV